MKFLVVVEVSKLSTNIYVIHNFVEKDNIKEIINFANSLNDKDWYLDDPQADAKNFFYGKNCNIINPKVLHKVNKKIKLLSDAWYTTKLQLHRYLPGDFITKHKDNQGSLSKHKDAYCYYGLVLYYNDDYIGGEIQYPELGITYKPISGDLVIHGSDIVHNTTEVKENIRYFSTSFLWNKKDSPVKLNPKIFV